MMRIARTNMNVGARAPLNEAVGGRELCAWQPVRGIVWVQTRNPKHARRMAQRQDSRLVAYGVAGGYLKTFEFRRSLAWAAAMMKRCLADKTATNAASNRAVCPVASRANLAVGGQGAEVGARAEACNGQNHG